MRTGQRDVSKLYISEYMTWINHVSTANQNTVRLCRISLLLSHNRSVLRKTQTSSQIETSLSAKESPSRKTGAMGELVKRVIMGDSSQATGNSGTKLLFLILQASEYSSGLEHPALLKEEPWVAKRVKPVRTSSSAAPLKLRHRSKGMRPRRRCIFSRYLDPSAFL